MRRTDRRREGLLALTLSGAVAAALVVGGISHRSDADTQIHTAPPSADVRLDNSTYARPLPPGFVGLSFEYTALLRYTGQNPRQLNPVLTRLIRGLAPGQAPILRIGGDSTDWTWAPTPGLKRPLGIRFTLTSRWLEVARALAQSTHARLILGINLEANRQRLAAVEAQRLIDGIGRTRIAALELGNEPELYRSFGWYRTRTGKEVPGRPRGYDFPIYRQEFAQFGAALPRLNLAGPAIGGQQWIHDTGPFVSAERRLQIVTLHRYPLQQCYLPASSHLYPTIPHLLSSVASTGLARSVAQYVPLAHARGLPLRVDEINTVSCGGASGVSDTFAAALWALDTMFELDRVGVDGVNVHTFPEATYALFRFTHANGTWHAFVTPEYYGLLMFARAAPPGSRLVRLTNTAGAQLHAWATRAPDRRVRVVLINDSPSRRQTVALSGDPSATGSATLARLAAPALQSTHGVTIHTSIVPHTGNGYLVSVPSASAAMLTLPRR